MQPRHTAIIDVPPEAVWQVLHDVDSLARWQPDLERVRCLARDEAGRPAQVEMVLRTVIRTVRAVLALSYEPPGTMSWTRHSGDVPNFTGSWTVTPLDPGRTQVEYRLEIDFGRLGTLVRGRLAAAAGDAVGSSMPHKLKTYVEEVHHGVHTR